MTTPLRRAALFAVVFVLGCGGSTGTITGTVIGTGGAPLVAASVTTDPATTSVVTDAAGGPLQVKVQVATTIRSQWGAQFGLGDTAISVASVAKIVGKPNLCVLALDPSVSGTIYLQKQAKVVGQNCAVYSNSTHPNGIKAYNSSMLTATMICSAGGKSGGQPVQVTRPCGRTGEATPGDGQQDGEQEVVDVHERRIRMSRVAAGQLGQRRSDQHGGQQRQVGHGQGA